MIVYLLWMEAVIGSMATSYPLDVALSKLLPTLLIPAGKMRGEIKCKNGPIGFFLPDAVEMFPGSTNPIGQKFQCKRGASIYQPASWRASVIDQGFLQWISRKLCVNHVLVSERACSLSCVPRRRRVPLGAPRIHHLSTFPAPVGQVSRPLPGISHGSVAGPSVHDSEATVPSDRTT